MHIILSPGFSIMHDPQLDPDQGPDFLIACMQSTSMFESKHLVDVHTDTKLQIEQILY